jgi:hypothetical protein
MSQETAEIERLRGQGVTGLQTVAEILEGEERANPPPVCFSPPRLDGSPELPEPGLYFGMSDEVYHSLPALSAHGIKYLAASPMIFWARTPWLSAKKAREVAEKAADEKQHHTLGKAYHCRIMEGRAEFERRFVVELDPADYPNALVHTDQIKAAISRHTETVPVKPCSAKKDELAAQLDRLRAGTNPGIVVGMAPVESLKVDELKDRIRQFTCEQPVRPWAKVEDFMPDSGDSYQRQCVKADWIRQLLELEPEAEIFDELQRQFLADHEGKSVISVEQHAQLEIAAAMVERDPTLQHAFKGGYPEVTLIWFCPKTGVPMKARVDYLKVKALVDLKTIANQRDRSIENAIRFEIASYHYNIQPCVYREADETIRALIRAHGKSVVHVAEDYPYPADEVTAWALKWASHKGDVEWLWVFQQKGDAPITRGVFYPLAGLTNLVTQDIVASAKRKFRQCSEAFGTDPWLDVKEPYLIADEDIPASATEI